MLISRSHELARRVFESLSIFVATASLVLAALPSEGAIFTVDSFLDVVDATPGDGSCSTSAATCTLRAAIIEANALPGSDRVVLPVGTYALTIADPIPDDEENGSLSGDLDLAGDLVLEGASPDCTTGSVIIETTEDLTVQVFVEPAISVLGPGVEISGVCVKDSQAGIVVAGRTSLEDVRVSSNGLAGLVISAGVRVIAHRTSFDQNGFAGLGVGIQNLGFLHLDESGVSSNDVGIDVQPNSVLQLTNSSLVANSGAGLQNAGAVVAANTTISTNGVDVSTTAGAPVSLTNVTIGGFGGGGVTGGADVAARNSILGVSCTTPITSLGYNVEKGTSCGLTAIGDQQSVSLGFAVGAGSQTLIPIPESVVRDLGDPVHCPLYDQLLRARPQTGGCDIGALELGADVACRNGLDDDGDGLCDALGGVCLDGSTPGDPGCVDADDPSEVTLVPDAVLVGDGPLKQLDPDTGRVDVLSSGLGLQGVFAVAAGEPGIFVTDGTMIFEIDPQTGMPTIVSGLGNLQFPRGLSLDSNGQLLAGDTLALRVVRIDPASGAQTVVSNGFFNGPEHVLEDPSDGTLLVSDFANSTPQGIYRIHATTGAVLEQCTGAPFGDTRQMVLSDDAQTLWVVDSGPNRVFAIDNTVSLTGCSAVQVGGGMGDAWGVSLDSSGDLIVASRNEGLFQFVDPSTGTQTIINESPDVVRPHEIARVPDVIRFYGVVGAGGAIWVRIAGVELSVTTTSGDTPADAAAALAAAISADLTLQALGVTATASGDRVIVDGALQAAMSTDPGLTLMPTSGDFDGDGLLDAFEIAHGFDPLSPGDETGDPDGDGLDNLGEQAAGTDPNDADTDDDGASDLDEINAGFDPLSPSQCGDGVDTDDDGLVDLADPDCTDPLDQTEFHIAQGDILVTSRTNPPAIWRIDPATDFVTKVAPLVANQLVEPAGLHHDIDGQLYVTDAGTHSLVRVDLEAATVTTIATGGPLDDPMGVWAQADDGGVLVADAVNGLIHVDPGTGVMTNWSTGNCAGDGARFVVGWNTGLIVFSAGGFLFFTPPDGSFCTEVGGFPWPDDPWGLVAKDIRRDLFQILDETTASLLDDDLGDISAAVPVGGAPYSAPRGVARGADGKLAVADIGAQTVFRVGPETGTATAVFTGHDFFGVTIAPFLARGHVYVVGSDNVLQRVDPLTGEQRVLHRGSPFASAFGVAESLDGRILVSNAGSNRGVHQVDRDSFAVTNLSPNQNFGVARYMSIDPSTGDALVCKQDGSVFRIDVFTGTQTGINSGAGIAWCEGVTANSVGDIVVVDRTNDRVVDVDPVTGTETPLVAFPLFVEPIDAAFDSDTTVLVTDDGDDTLYRLDLVGGTRSVVTSGQHMATPRGVSVDELGNVYLVDRNGGLIWYDPTGLSFNNQVVIASGSTFSQALGVATALPMTCGDGFEAPEEECDDGNLVSGDGCSSLCELEICGDGVLQTLLGELCDDGNGISGDGCSDSCQLEFDPVDQIITWSAPAILSGPSALAPTAPDISTDGAGQWIAVWGEDGGPPAPGVSNVMVSLSPDGSSWTPPALAAQPFGSQPVLPTLRNDGAGKWITTYSGEDLFGFRFLHAATSIDGGLSWLSQPIAWLNVIGSRSGLAADASDHWVAMTSDVDSTEYYAFPVTSMDGGTSWLPGTAVPFSGTGQNIAGFGVHHVETDGAGTWITAFDLEGGVSRSIDGGLTWSARQLVLGPTLGFPMSIGALATDRLGTWMVAGISFGVIDPGVATSTDGGLTWNATASTVLPIFGALVADGAGNWVGLTSSSAQVDGAYGTDKDVLIQHSNDGGMTWTMPRAIDPGATTDTAADTEPRLATDRLGTWVAVWTDGSDIRYALGYGPDTDLDGLYDGAEANLYGTDPRDDDSDDDGILDGNEVLGGGAAAAGGGMTDPLRADTDGDGLLDGTEIGLTAPQGNDTDLGVFVPDADPSTTTDPTLADTDGDGLSDGQEDANGNGQVDPGESDPNVATPPPALPVLGWPATGWLVLGLAVIGWMGAIQRRRSV